MTIKTHVTLLTAIASILAVPSSAFAVSNGNFATITASSNGKVVEAKSNSAGGEVALKNQNYGNGQAWLFKSSGSGYQLKNAQGFCMGLPSWSTTRATLLNCDNSSTQTWETSTTAFGNSLKNTQTGECLTTVSWSPDQMTMRPCDSNSQNQSFNIADTYRREAGPSGEIESALYSGNLIGLTQYLNRAGAEAYLAVANQGVDHLWKKVTLKSGENTNSPYFQLETSTPNGGSLCLGLANWSDYKPTALYCGPGTVDQRQQWTAYPGSSNPIAFRNRATNKCLTISNMPISGGKKLTMRDCASGRLDQKFNLGN